MENKKVKYTTDGKKVVVIGDLNQTEKIVQEVYVTDDGCELPTGERFVVKSLLDSPAKSWKEKELEKLELRYEKESEYWEAKIKQMIKEKNSAYSALSDRVKWLRNVAKEPQMKSLNHALNVIADFMDGSEKWIMVNSWKGFMLEKFNDEGVSKIMDYFNDGRYDSMRLLSLFGDSNGNFDFRINGYSDGSGSSEKVLFFKSKDEALKYLQDNIDNKSEYNDRDIETINKYQLRSDTTKYNEYQNGLIEHSSKRISELIAALEKEQKNRKELKANLRK